MDSVSCPHRIGLLRFYLNSPTHAGFPGDLPRAAQGAAVQSHDDEDQSMCQRGTVGVHQERSSQAELAE